MLLFSWGEFSGGLSVPPRAASAAPTAKQQATPADQAFGKPFSELPLEAQLTVLAKIPSSAGGLDLSPESESTESESDAGTADASTR